MKEKDLSTLLNQGAKAMNVQKHQSQKVEAHLAELQNGFDEIEHIDNSNSELIDTLLQDAEKLCDDLGLDSDDLSDEDMEAGLDYIQLSETEYNRIPEKEFTEIETISGLDGEWQQYIDSVEQYAATHNIVFSEDPFSDIMTASEKEEIARRVRDDYRAQKCNCDKYDYIIASFCGTVSGLIDSLFVGMPGDSKLGKWTDTQADKFVEKFALGIWNSDNAKRNKLMKQGISKTKVLDKLEKCGIPSDISQKKPDTLQKCIQYLEKRYKVNYDATNAGMLETSDGVLEHMWTKNHHLKSLAHAPHVVGLIFSILDQFTGKATFVDNGKIVRAQPKEQKESFTLVGQGFIQKLFFGFTNWVGHLISDYVGSNSSRAKMVDGNTLGRGSGLGIPFYEMFQFCNFGQLDVDGKEMNISELSIKIFENGYDLRFAQTMAIPVALNEICIRLLWAIKSKFYHKRTWQESMPFGNHPELRRMLLVGQGAFCLVDGIDASIRSATIIDFALRMNLVEWSKFAMSALQEIRIHFKENCLDINAINLDLEKEWIRLYGEG